MSKPDIHEDEHERRQYPVRDIGSPRDEAEAAFRRVFDYRLWQEHEQRPIVWPVGAAIPIKP